ncbi:MAG: response regulator transcription factor [Bacteroidetes bacterium]|nr:MAG: response regulator transcription factor [Bacteroidota bacterium]
MADTKLKILLVDDEPDILEFLKYNLQKEGYDVFVAPNGKLGIELARKEKPDLIILDIMMPEMDGIETCRLMREIPEFKETMIVFLTARNEDYSQIAGFGVGADDYITKPVKPRVLLSRISALFRRYQGQNGVLQQNENFFIAGDLKIDREQYIVSKGDEKIELPRKEFELLALIAAKPGKVFTREEILDRIWGSDVIVGDRTIDVHIRKLREKFGDDMIKTVKGIGYKFDL